MEKEPAIPRSPMLPGTPVPSWTRRTVQWTGLVLVGGVLATGAFFLLRTPPPNGDAVEPEEQEFKLPANLFQGWKKPDLALVLSGQMKGYLQPCGCSHPQYGGLARRYSFVKTLRDHGWPVLAVDLGEIAQETGPQAKLKYEYSMKALNLIGYKAIGLGRAEMLMPLIDALGQYSANNPQPRPLAANLKFTDEGQLFHDLNVRKTEIVTAGPLKVGVVGVVGRKEVEKIEALLPPNEKEVRFDDNGPVLTEALQKFGANRTDLSVLLYQGMEKDARLAARHFHAVRAQNNALMPLHVIVCLTDQEEPPGLPTKDPQEFPNTCIITLGHKGRYVGVVGVWRTPKGLDLKYQLVSVGPEFETKAGEEKANPVMALMEDYALKVKAGNYLAKYPRGKHPIQANAKYKDAHYVGSAACAICHKHATEVWNKSQHSHAFDTLVKAKNPGLRHYDGECVVCHTVGFKYDSGYYDPIHAEDPLGPVEKNKLLLHVGCESCHGPGSEHVRRPRDKELRKLMNPYGPSEKERDLEETLADAHKKGGKVEENEQLKSMLAQYNLLKRNRMLDIDMKQCQSCHDIENDVHWGQIGFEKKWIGGGIIHLTPPAEKARLRGE